MMNGANVSTPNCTRRNKPQQKPNQPRERLSKRKQGEFESFGLPCFTYQSIESKEYPILTFTSRFSGYFLCFFNHLLANVHAGKPWHGVYTAQSISKKPDLRGTKWPLLSWPFGYFFEAASVVTIMINEDTEVCRFFAHYHMHLWNLARHYTRLSNQ